jgi:hypothetical protein
VNLGQAVKNGARRPREAFGAARRPYLASIISARQHALRRGKRNVAQWFPFVSDCVVIPRNPCNPRQKFWFRKFLQRRAKFSEGKGKSECL